MSAYGDKEDYLLVQVMGALFNPYSRRFQKKKIAQVLKTFCRGSIKHQHINTTKRVRNELSHS